ncbi:MAG: regulatory protein RecX [Lachnospiraceae bacterium]|nr:regulatory protein RecX [Lachnospiraceae bacterium]
MQIEQIVPLDKKRSRVCLDNGMVFALYKGEIRALALQEGQEVSAALYQEIYSGILLKRAKRRMLYLLGQMDRTEAQIRQKLQQGGYPEGIIEEAIAYAMDAHYLDDARYARNYVRSQQEKKSREQMRMSLYRKGIRRELAEQALESEYILEDEQELILKWVQKKNYPGETASLKEKRRICQFLMRKGFHMDDILHVLDHLT